MTPQFDHLQSAIANRYAVESVLGEGGMATVYIAKDVKHGRRVALKVLRPDLAATVGTKRFLREIEIASKLAHPNILPLYDSGAAEAFLFYTMPYVEGESLGDRLKREKQLPIEDALRITREVGDALSYAHSSGIVHRDIKPGNILFQAGHAVLADFGVARAITRAGCEALTATGLAVGTPTYMSPEAASGTGEIDARTDIYSLGCVLYEMLVGDPPFTGSTAQAILTRKLIEAAPSPRVVRETVPEFVEAAVAKALARTPADRFSAAEQFVEALTGGAGHATTRPSLAGWRARRRLRWALPGLAVVAVAAGGLSWWLLGDEKVERSRPDIETLQLFNEGQFQLSKLTESAVLESILLLRQALDRDPRFVDGWVALAEAYCLRAISTGAMDPREAMPNCKDAAEKALEIDATLAEAHAVLAMYYQDYAWNQEAAGRELHRAIQLDPNSASAHIRFAIHYSLLERYEEAFEASTRAIQLAPTDAFAWVNAGMQRYFAEQYQAALPFIDRALQLTPDYAGAHWLRGAVYAELGRYNSATESLRQASGVAGPFVWRAWLGYAYALAGDTEQAEAAEALLVEEIADGAPISSNLAVGVAMIHIGRGSHDEAFRWLQEAVESRSTILGFVLASPVSKRLVGDPRLPELLTTVGLRRSNSAADASRQ